MFAHLQFSAPNESARGGVETAHSRRRHFCFSLKTTKLTHVCCTHPKSPGESWRNVGLYTGGGAVLVETIWASMRGQTHTYEWEAAEATSEQNNCLRVTEHTHTRSSRGQSYYCLEDNLLGAPTLLQREDLVQVQYNLGGSTN